MTDILRSAESSVGQSQMFSYAGQSGRVLKEFCLSAKTHVIDELYVAQW